MQKMPHGEDKEMEAKQKHLPQRSKDPEDYKELNIPKE